jgi:hypothetical protein
LDGTHVWSAEKDAFVAAESAVGFGIAFQGGRTGTSGGESLSPATLEDRGRVTLRSLTPGGLADAPRKAQGGDEQGPAGGPFSTDAGWGAPGYRRGRR